MKKAMPSFPPYGGGKEKHVRELKEYLFKNGYYKKTQRGNAKGS